MKQINYYDPKNRRCEIRSLDDVFHQAMTQQHQPLTPADTHLIKLVQNNPNWTTVFKDEYKLSFIESQGLTILDILSS